MTKRDIKRGTGLIMIFCLFVAVCIVVSLCRNPEPSEGEELTAVAEGTPWMDTLTNQSSSWEALAPMDKEIERFMQKWEIKGMSFAVSRHDSLLYTKGYGWADREAGIEMQPDNIMRIASASKLVTAIAVMKLIEQGKMKLDSRIFGEGGLMPDTVFTAAMCDKRMLDITVDHLLRHQGGFGLGAGDPMFTTAEIMAAKHLDTPPTPEELVKIVLGRRIAYTPGAGRRYSNFGYMLLSMAIERVTGMSYWDYVTENILRPAGCLGFRPATNYYADRSTHEVKYYGPDNELVEEFNGSGRMVERIYGGNNVNALMGAGGWCASAAELCRLVAATDKDPRMEDVITANSVELLTAHSDKEKLSRGWSEVDAHGKWTRTGTLSSTHTLIERFPDGECWVLITNSGVWTGHHFSSDMNRLVERLRSRYSRLLPSRNLF